MHSPAKPPKHSNPQANSYSITRENRRHGSAPTRDANEQAATAPGLKPDPFGGPPAPSWLQFFAMGSNARFTRTPDYLLRTDFGTVTEIAPLPAVPEDAGRWADHPADSPAPQHVQHYVRRPAVWAPPRPAETVVAQEPALESTPAIEDPQTDSWQTDPWQTEPWMEPGEADLATAEFHDADEAASAQPEAMVADDIPPTDEPATDEPATDEPTPSEDPLQARLRTLAQMIQVGRPLRPVKAERQDNQRTMGPRRATAHAPLPPATEADAGLQHSVQEPSLPALDPRGLGALPSVSVNVSFAWPSLLPSAEDAPDEAQVEDENAVAEPVVEEPLAARQTDEIIASDPAPQPVWPTDDFGDVPAGFELPPLSLLAEPSAAEPNIEHSAEHLDKNSVTLQQTLHDFGIRGEIIDANPGPVVTLYELEPAPGTKSSRVIGLADDIARSMSAISARVAVVPGRNVIGIELPNQRRETVWLRALLASREFEMAQTKLGLCLGKTIGGEPVIVDLARMPHLLVAGTTGSGKSVSVNAMILSLLYRHTPEACRMIMIDPKMLELSIYEGIPHLLTPVVTDPRKAVVALKWAVREMEERYKKMSRLGVRSIDGFNARANEARLRGTGLVGSDGEPIDATPLPFIVVIVDEMADLMMVAGKEIEGAIQRLAQMARAAGIHLIMATQRPSVDVITGTIKANFPTRISFQVTSKIDSRTILGEQGAEQLLGQGDMLYMAGGGRLTRVHGPFVSDNEVEKVVEHLKRQGRPDYLDAVTTSNDEEVDNEAEGTDEDGAVFDKGTFGEEGADLYDQAIMIVMRDKKASTSYIQRRLQIGYNRAASIMERMENEGIVGPANHAGKREILVEAVPGGFRKT
ncbi:DNA translocase FtsK [Chelatococcus sp. GCM10030263]|uniref:DNA translocase FtsK n=1 Tax=Chelatococcus sp. GCM10030263 TaxID=3273387 RepID=UPI0036221686